jgi:hypothetical protein
VAPGRRWKGGRDANTGLQGWGVAPVLSALWRERWSLRTFLPRERYTRQHAVTPARTVARKVGTKKEEIKLRWVSGKRLERPGCRG